MKKAKGFSFWMVILLTLLLIPGTALAAKQLWMTNLTDSSGRGVGSAVLTVKPSTIDYMVRTYAVPPDTILEVFLSEEGGVGFVIPLCSNIDGPTINDCTYDSAGNLDLEGAINPAVLMSAGVSGGQFNTALREGRLRLNVSYEADSASGIFGRII